MYYSLSDANTLIMITLDKTRLDTTILATRYIVKRFIRITKARKASDTVNVEQRIYLLNSPGPEKQTY